MQLPTVSVVIPTHQRPESLLRVLDALSRQEGVDQQRIQLVVVCDGLDDPAFEAVKQGWYPMRLRLAEQKQQGPAAARNHGLALATGQLIVFVDDDVVPDRRFLAVHQVAHADDLDLVAIGPLLPPTGHGTPWVRWEGRTVARQYEEMAAGKWEVSPRQFYTGNASVRRERLVQALGFDVTFTRGEDVELAFRLRERGLHFRFLPEATAQHLAERSYHSWISAAEAYGRCDVRMGRERGHQDLLDSVAREFSLRHPLTRVVGRAAIRWPFVAKIATWSARPISLFADRLRMPLLGQAALSAAFNAVQLRGLAEEVGGPQPALLLLNQSRPRPKPVGTPPPRRAKRP